MKVRRPNEKVSFYETEKKVLILLNFIYSYFNHSLLSADHTIFVTKILKNGLHMQFSWSMCPRFMMSLSAVIIEIVKYFSTFKQTPVNRFYRPSSKRADIVIFTMTQVQMLLKDGISFCDYQ